VPVSSKRERKISRKLGNTLKPRALLSHTATMHLILKLANIFKMGKQVKVMIDKKNKTKKKQLKRLRTLIFHYLFLVLIKNKDLCMRLFITIILFHLFPKQHKYL